MFDKIRYIVENIASPAYQICTIVSRTLLKFKMCYITLDMSMQSLDQLSQSCYLLCSPPTEFWHITIILKCQFLVRHNSFLRFSYRLNCVLLFWHFKVTVMCQNLIKGQLRKEMEIWTHLLLHYLIFRPKYKIQRIKKSDMGYAKLHPNLQRRINVYFSFIWAENKCLHKQYRILVDAIWMPGKK